jgi:hypothetical protein
VASLQRVQAYPEALCGWGDGTGRRRQLCGSGLPGQMASGGARGKAVLRRLAGVEHDARKQPRLGRQACWYSGGPWVCGGRTVRRRRASGELRGTGLGEVSCGGSAELVDKEARLRALGVRGAPGGQATGTATGMARARVWLPVSMPTLCTRALGAATAVQTCLAGAVNVQEMIWAHRGSWSGQM